MKTIRLLLLIAVAALLFSCHGKKTEEVGVQPLAKQTTLQADGVMGKVKLIIEKKYMRIPTTDSVALYAIHYQYFNENGWILKDVITNDANDTIFNTHVTYNAQGIMVKRETCDSTHSITEHTDFQIDKNGYRIKETTYKGDSLATEITYKNDAAGNVLEMSVQTTNLCILKYTYDGPFYGLPTRIDQCGHDGRMFMYITMDYNDRGQLVNRRAFSANGAEVESSHSQYAENGALMKQTHELMLQSLQKRDLCTFENHDKYGNWLKQKMLRQGELHYIIERTIEYY